MRVMVVGGTGTIGSAVADALEERHEVLRVGHTSGDRQVDLASRSSIRSLLDSAGEVEAVVCAAGNAAFGPLSDLDAEDMNLSLHSKLRGQFELARLAFQSISDGGSITLTSGVLAAEPTPGSAAVSMVNAGVEGFVRAAALEAPRGIRINVVSPPWVAETLEEGQGSLRGDAGRAGGPELRCRRGGLDEWGGAGCAGGGGVGRTWCISIGRRRRPSRFADPSKARCHPSRFT